MPAERDTWPKVQGLPRPRLLAFLAKPADVTLVVAPAGSGKTTLLAQYTAESQPPAAWYRAEPEDCDPDRLRARLATVLAARSGSANPGPTTLVIDDFHVLMDTPAEAAADHLLSHMPPGLRIFVASRRVPTLNLSRAELGTVTVLTADDLRFRSWEVERLFAEVYGEPLPPRDAAALTRRTEGWAASLQLFHLSTQGRPLTDRRRAITALSGRSRFARSYLTRTVLDELPPELRDFLRSTCVFEVLTAERCDRLLGTTDAQRHLEHLERWQALTTSDDGGRTFRYHEVLRRHLESALVEHLGVSGVREWYAAAADLLEAEGALCEALRGYVLAERWPDAARLLKVDGHGVVNGDANPGWAELLPARLVDTDPWLCLAAGRQLAAEGRLPEAVQRYRQAECLFTDPPERELAAKERRLVELWTGAPAQPHLHWADRLRTALHREPLTAADVGSGSDSAGELLCRAVALLLAGDAVSAADAIGAADLLEDQPGTDQPGTGFLGYATRLVTVAAAGVRGLAGADTVERLAAEAERDGVAWIARQCRALRNLIGSHGQPSGNGFDRLPTRHLVGECERSGDTWGALLVYGMNALGHLLLGEPSAEEWQDLSGRCNALEAGSPEAWALGFGAIAATVEGLPYAESLAQRAEANARAVGVPGAQVLALLAMSSHDQRRRGELVALAQALAHRHGMPWPGRLAERLLTEQTTAPSVVSESQSPMTLRCFGGFELRLPDRILDWRPLRPRAAMMLRLLSVHAGHPVHRETMMAALWPDLPIAQARHNLQVTVSTLRRFLEPESPRGAARIVVRVGDAYALVPPPGSDVDVTSFVTARQDAQRAYSTGSGIAERQALRRAVDTYGGDLLPADGPAEWVVADRERFRVQAAIAAGRLAELECAEGDISAAIGTIRRSLEIDPFRDVSWRLLIGAYQTLGDGAAAERTRRDYAEMLATLGIGYGAGAGAAEDLSARSMRHPGTGSRNGSRPVRSRSSGPR